MVLRSAAASQALALDQNPDGGYRTERHPGAGVRSSRWVRTRSPHLRRKTAEYLGFHSSEDALDVRPRTRCTVLLFALPLGRIATTRSCADRTGLLLSRTFCSPDELSDLPIAARDVDGSVQDYRPSRGRSGRTYLRGDRDLLYPWIPGRGFLGHAVPGPQPVRAGSPRDRLLSLHHRLFDSRLAAGTGLGAVLGRQGRLALAAQVIHTDLGSFKTLGMFSSCRDKGRSISKSRTRLMETRAFPRTETISPRVSRTILHRDSMGISILGMAPRIRTQKPTCTSRPPIKARPT